jgi:hypothetical protein
VATGDDEETLDALVMAPTQVDAADAAPAGDTVLRTGDTVARYRIDGFLGRGGMGVVYRARDPDLDRALAIKLVGSRRIGVDRMMREAQAMARLDHPNVVPIFDVGMHGDQLFLAMPFLAGGTLGEWCRAAPRPWREVVARYVAAGRGLHAAHRAGLVHRDFKPDNVLVDADGGVHVADFGLARAQHDGVEAGTGATSGPLTEALTLEGELLGTPAYMAPEQLDGRSVDARADQFSFCVALYEGLYGERPFVLPAHAAGIAVLREAMRLGLVRPAPADRDVPRRVRDVVLRGLRDAPAARWPSMEVLLDQLERARGVSRPWRWVLAAAALAVAVAIGAWIALRRETSAPPGETPMVARQITFRGDIDRAALSPDRRLVAARAGQELVVVPVAPGGEVRGLIRDFDREEVTHAIAWTPDSRQVMTVRRREGTLAPVELVDVATGARERHPLEVWPLAAMSGPREVASARSTDQTLRFTELDGVGTPRECPLPGDYTRIFAVEAGGDSIFVARQDADGRFSVVRTDRTCATTTTVIPPTSGMSTIVDPDGSHVGVLRELDGRSVLERTPVRAGAAIRRSRPLPPRIVAIHGVVDDRRLVATRIDTSWRLVRVAGDPAQIVATLGVGSFDQFHAVSPDGSHVAVVDDRDGATRALRVVPLDRLDARVAPFVTNVSTASWSRDGRRLAAMIMRDDGVDLAIVTTATGAITRIPVADGSPAQPVWLDDRRVAYLRADIRTYVVLDLQSGTSIPVMDPDVGFTFELAMHPSDGSLAWFWSRAPGAGVYVQRPGTSPELVVPSHGTRLAPSWSPDGRALWIRGADGTIEHHDLATGRHHRVFALSETSESIVGLVPTADGSVVLDLLRSTSDLVVLE